MAVASKFSVLVAIKFIVSLENSARLSIYEIHRNGY
jgi:hypothetical protein